jgi:Ca2+-binding EF-hand superfamily protein
MNIKEYGLLTLALGFTAAVSAGLLGMGKPAFSDLDKNSDGQLTQEEAAVDSELANNFDVIDQDGNGYITTAEYNASVENDTSGDS